MSLSYRPLIAAAALAVVGGSLMGCDVVDPPIARTQLNICPVRTPATYYADENTRFGYLQSVGEEPGPVSISEVMTAHLASAGGLMNYEAAVDSPYIASGHKQQVCDPSWPGPFVMTPGHYGLTGKTQSCEFENPSYNPCVVHDVTVYSEFDIKPF